MALRGFNKRTPQIRSPLLSTCVSKRAQTTRVSGRSLSSFADLARVRSSKKGSRSGGFSYEDGVLDGAEQLRGAAARGPAHARHSRRHQPYGTTGPQSRVKSSFFIALICTTSRRIPATARQNQGPEQRRFDHTLIVASPVTPNSRSRDPLSRDCGGCKTR